ncbi:MAG: agmatinase family protein, partial [Flammeovirgaceae bacterium]|nr:agmatinase family protein [Flammeovirgaceae bacterium]
RFPLYDSTDISEKSAPEQINEGSKYLNQWVYETSKSLLEKGKLVGLLGGDHSTPNGFIKAIAEKYTRFAILQIDAHADLRNAYEGFVYSHASIMFNALKLPAVSQLVQVGIRDYCNEELDVINNSKGRVKTFFDEDIKESMLKGKTWETICKEIVTRLPDNVYISFDIDGLDPKLCPNTGTPVAGGFEFHEIVLLLKVLAQSGKRIIGFDLNEVSPGDSEWDANVGARILYQLCNWMGVSQGKLEMIS